MAARIRSTASALRAARALALLGSFAACSEAAPPTPPIPEVAVVTAVPQAVPNVIELPGRLQAVRTAEVRARVDGILEQILYTEGSDVVAGQQLFQIDPRELRAERNAARAALARAEAMAANANQDVKRYEGLVASRAISQQEYDTAVARVRTAQADVAQARAQVEAAELNLSHTDVKAPIAGRAGRAEVTEGAFVRASNATLLTRIEQIDPIYVNFSQASSDVLAIRKAIRSGEIEVPELQRVAVRLVLEDGVVYGHEGHLDFFDYRIDETTGSAALRAAFPNSDRLLLPGQFVSAKIEAGVRPHGMLLPQRAVRVTREGAVVLVVGKDDVVESRAVQAGSLQGGSWVILSGLAAGERVIVDGLQKAEPGKPVRIAQRAPDGPSPVGAADGGANLAEPNGSTGVSAR
jgi:membrane fusion protein, multidrug efflux system